MRIITCYSANPTETTIMRGLVDGERRLVISCQAGEVPIHTYLKIRDQLTEDEIRAVRVAFGWEPARA